MMKSSLSKTLRWTVCVLALAGCFAFTALRAQDGAAPEAAPAAEVAADAQADAAAPAADEAAPAPAEEAPAAAAEGDAAACGTDDQADPGYARLSFFGLYGLYWLLALAGSVAALFYACKFFKAMMRADEGNDEMKSIAAAVREGANAYLKQ